MKIRIKKTDPRARIPKRATPYSAGADLYMICDGRITIKPGETYMAHTGLCFEIPAGYAGLVYARSGLSVKRGIAPANKVGVIDSDYRGEVLVALFNQGVEPQILENGERIAQLVITPVIDAEYSESPELSGSERGDGGFGSTGDK